MTTQQDYTVLADVFPAEVVLPNGTMERRARVFVFDDGVSVFTDRGGRPVKVYAQRHREPPTLPGPYVSRIRWRATIRTADGDMFVTKTSGCGCHSVLMQMLPHEVRA